MTWLAYRDAIFLAFHRHRLPLWGANLEPSFVVEIQVSRSNIFRTFPTPVFDAIVIASGRYFGALSCLQVKFG